MAIQGFKMKSGDWLKAAAVTISLVLFLSASFATAFFWMIFFIWWTFRLDSRIVGIAALLFLVMIPVLLATGQETRAEQLAVYTFFLLVITVALQIIQLIREDRRAAKKAVPKTPAEPVEETPAPTHVLNLKGRRRKGKKIKVEFAEGK